MAGGNTAKWHWLDAIANLMGGLYASMKLSQRKGPDF
jgi:hypothetical protein